MTRLSIILPYYKRLTTFSYALKQNATHFSRSGVEVVLVLDEPTDAEAILLLVAAHPQIKWRVLCNPKDHDWRVPAKAINVGLRHATGTNVLVMSPESVIYTSSVSLHKPVTERLAQPGERFFMHGRVIFADIAKDIPPTAQTLQLSQLKYGSLCVSRANLIAAGGYRESLEGWGGDDDELRRRLRNRGLTSVDCADVLLLHYDKNRHVHSPELEAWKAARADYYKMCETHNYTVANGKDDWGLDFNTVIYQS